MPKIRLKTKTCLYPVVNWTFAVRRLPARLTTDKSDPIPREQDATDRTLMINGSENECDRFADRSRKTDLLKSKRIPLCRIHIIIIMFNTGVYYISLLYISNNLSVAVIPAGNTGCRSLAQDPGKRCTHHAAAAATGREIERERE